MRLLSKLNPNVAAIKPYEPGRPIEEVARELGLDPQTIIKLASNESALGPSPKAIAAIHQYAASSHLYPDGACYELRDRLAAFYGLPPAQFLIGNGSNEILELVGHCFLQPGRSAVFSEYSFVVYKLVSTLFGARRIEVPARRNYGHDLDAMLNAIERETAVVFVCNPNNPTGTIAAPDEIERFVEAVPEDVLVVLDEAYVELALAPLPNSLALLKRRENLLICRTFSKAYGLAGLRLGYAIGHPELVRALNQSRQPFNVNLLAQVAGAAALDDQEFVAKLRDLCRQGKDYLEAECRAHGWEFVPGYGNFMMIKVGDGDGITRQLQQRGVIVRPMSAYKLPEFIRVTFGTMPENERLLRNLAELMPARN